MGLRPVTAEETAPLSRAISHISLSPTGKDGFPLFFPSNNEIWWVFLLFSCCVVIHSG